MIARLSFLLLTFFFNIYTCIYPVIFFADRSKSVLLLLIFFVLYVPCFIMMSVCSLQPCAQLLGKALLCVVVSCVLSLSIWSSGSGMILN